MYVDFFRLREKPFNVTPDPHFLYMSPSHQEAFATLLYGVRERKGFVMVTGEVGTGKTTLLHNLLENLDPKTQSVFVFHTGLDFIDLLETIHHELQIPFESRTRAALLQSLNRHLIQRLEEGANTVLIIDEAQNLSPEVLENLRLLSNLETAKDKLLQIILVGQIELEDTMALPQLRQLRQRIAVQSRLSILSAEESRTYVLHRLEIAGGGKQGAALFSEEALKLVCHRGQGIPRQLNVICDNALLIAYAEGEPQVKTQHVREALRDREINPPKSKRRDAAPPPPRQGKQARPAGRRALRVFALLTGVLALAVLMVGGYRLGMHRWFPDENTLKSKLLNAAMKRSMDEADPIAEARADRIFPPGDSAVFQGIDPWAAEIDTTPVRFPSAIAETEADAPERDLKEALIPGPEPTSRPELVTASEAAAVGGSDREIESASPASTSPAAVADGGREASAAGSEKRVRWVEFPKEREVDEHRDPPQVQKPRSRRTPGDLARAYAEAKSHRELQAVLDRCARKAYIVQEGEYFSSLVQDKTGRNDAIALDVIERMNPHIRDFDHIEPGWVVYIPELEEPSP